MKIIQHHWQHCEIFRTWNRPTTYMVYNDCLTPRHCKCTNSSIFSYAHRYPPAGSTLRHGSQLHTREDKPHSEGTIARQFFCTSLWVTITSTFVRCQTQECPTVYASGPRKQRCMSPSQLPRVDQRTDRQLIGTPLECRKDEEKQTWPASDASETKPLEDIGAMPWLSSE